MTTIQRDHVSEIRKYHGKALAVLETLMKHVSYGYVALHVSNDPRTEHLARAIEIVEGMQRVHEIALREATE